MKQYKEFKQIKNEYKKAQINHIKELKAYYDSMTADELNERAINRKLLTKKQMKLSLAQKRKLVIQKESKYYYDNIEAFNTKCDRIAKAQPVDAITIRVEWCKNRVWGMNPHATVYANKVTTGAASGCGYDKLSTAISEALNKNYGILTRLFNYYESQLRKEKNPERKNPHTLIHYGAGYITPYFEGGVGYTSIKGVFDTIGAKSNCWNDGKTWDFMQIEF